MRHLPTLLRGLAMLAIALAALLAAPELLHALPAANPDTMVGGLSLAMAAAVTPESIRDEILSAFNAFKQANDDRLGELEAAHNRRQLGAGGDPSSDPAARRRPDKVTAADVALFSSAFPVKGFSTPADVQNALSTTGAGSVLAPEEHLPQLLEFLAAQSVALRSGLARWQTQSDSMRVPKLTADVTAAWTAEAATIGASDPSFEDITATPRKLAARTILSNELIADSNPSAIAAVQRSMFRSLGLKLDLGIFEGTGVSPEITGIKNVSGIQEVSMGTNGAALTTLDPFVDAIAALAQENAAATAIVLHPRTWKTILKLKDSDGHPLVGSAVNGTERRIYGVPVFLSSQLSITETQGSANNASSAYVYQADQGVVVMRQELRLEVDRSRLFDSDQSEARAILRADFVVPNPKAFVRVKGIIPS